VGNAGFILCYVALLLMRDWPSPALLWFMVLAQGLLGYGLTSVVGAIPAEIFQGRHYGGIFGTLMGVGIAGGALGPWVTGALYDASGSYAPAFSLAIACSLASALCIWLLLPTLTAYLLFEVLGRRRRFATSAGTGGRLELPVPRAARIALEGIAALVLLLIGSLYLVVVAGSFVRVWGIDFTLTLDHYLRVDPGLAQLHGLPTVWTSVKIAGFAAPLGGLLSLVIAYLVERVRPPGGNAIGFVALLPAVLPGVILGIGYLIFFNNPFGLSSLALTGTGAILVINILFANLYVGVLAGRAALQRLDPAVEEAAEALGASVAQTFRLVTLPMIRRVLTLSTLYVFVHGITTLSAVIFLVSPEHKLASVGIFIAAETAHYGIACATSTAVLVIVLGAMALAWMIERWDPVRRRSMAAAAALAEPRPRTEQPAW